jgi:guanylate kinase|tara:strand:+ start:159 stop:605 length:447 start_codon:yes stop_codon:yes gene_type:complete
MLNKKICIFGPPCVGKTTLAYTALKNKIPSFTTHDYNPSMWQSNEEFFTRILNLDIPLFLDVGGKNIGWIDGGDDIKTVLLLPPRDVYLERERMDIENIGEHRNQSGIQHYDDLMESKSEFDLVIEDVLSPQEIFDYIIETMELKNEL